MLELVKYHIHAVVSLVGRDQHVIVVELLIAHYAPSLVFVTVVVVLASFVVVRVADQDVVLGLLTTEQLALWLVLRHHPT